MVSYKILPVAAVVSAANIAILPVAAAFYLLRATNAARNSEKVRDAREFCSEAACVVNHEVITRSLC